MRVVRNFCGLVLVTLGIAAADPVIKSVVNAGSRIDTGFPGAGLAQGAIFAVTGTDVGVDPMVQATFPLPTADGLSGVTVQATVNGTTVDCILVYVSANEVGAILPSGTPTGSGTLTVNNNGTTLTSPISVVPAAFGIFTQSQSGSGAAEAFNVAGDGSTALNTLTAPAAPGQAILLNGTGLGAIASDETQSGVTDTPGGSPQVWVGLKQATVVSASRGSCCNGIDASFRVPQGVAGWDVIQFVVPDGITGCHVPVVVQTGDKVSNFTSIAISNGGACTDPGAFSSDSLLRLSGSSARTAHINLRRASTKITAAGMTLTSNTDLGSADFYQYDVTQFQAGANFFSNVTALGSCYVTLNHQSAGAPPIFTLPTGLDAGNAINVKGPNGSKQMTPVAKQMGSYTGTFGTSTSGLPSLPALPPGVPLPPGLPGGPGTQPFLEAGSYTVDNGGGGADVGPFTATLAVKTPLTWTNQDALTQVNRAQGIPITWTGGDPAGTVIISGGVTNTVGTSDIYVAAFICMAPVSAGQFTVPSIVTLSLPPSSQIAGGPGIPATPTGTLSVGTTVTGTFTAPSIDLGTISSSVLALKNLAYI